MSRYVSEKLAAEVIQRAGGRCEYCRISIDDTYFGGEIDHIRSLKHGGKTELDNLAFACHPCNRSKGSDLGSIYEPTGELIRFYDPRLDDWFRHFDVLSNGRIEPRTAIGTVTTAIFRFNDIERIDERLGLIELGRYFVSRDDEIFA